MAKFTSQDFEATLKLFATASNNKHGNDNHALQMVMHMLAVTMAEQPKVRQNELMRFVNLMTKDMLPEIKL
jgi:hypothetical protein